MSRGKEQQPHPLSPKKPDLMRFSRDEILKAAPHLARFRGNISEDGRFLGGEADFYIQYKETVRALQDAARNPVEKVDEQQKPIEFKSKRPGRPRKYPQKPTL